MRKIANVLLILFSVQAHADEGMFMPFSLKQNYKDMKAKGLEMSYKKIYNTKKPSVKDAVVSLGGFCTAEIISTRGLMLTNHHCGYDAIREKSTPENDYLTDGFWAANCQEEKPISGLTATIIVKMMDVTADIKMALRDNMDADTRSKMIKQKSDELVLNAVAGTHYSAHVKDFFEGNEFYLIVEETFMDIRLVGAPPSAIGKYGGDTDNWMWTRHTGDFSMFRIYADENNSPAEFAMDNQPYTPKYHLPINIGGVQKGDFSFIMGYPGSTDRYLSSYGVKMAVEKDQPSRVKIRGKKLEILKANMNTSDVIRIQYASTYARVSNYWKYFLGQSEQLQKNGVADKKKKIEAAFSDWINAEPDSRSIYQNVLYDMREAYKVLNTYHPTSVYYFEAIYSIALNRFMVNHYRLYKLLSQEELDHEEITAVSVKLAARSADFWETFNYETEVKLIEEMLDLYHADIPVDQHTILLDSLANKYESWSDFAHKNLKNSVFSDKDRYEKFIKNPTKSALKMDALFLLNCDLLDNYRRLSFGPAMNNASVRLSKANRLFVQALREIYPDKKFYPNANFTLRLTYGNILPYSVHGNEYEYYTTIEGLMAKEDPANEEFIVPTKLKELYMEKDYGRYGKDSTLWINFISNNDITGGSSGSPVMNSKGELIGCAFDGNWEAMSGDIAFEKDFQRTISADIRYILFVIDKYAGAKHLIDEMTIVE